MIDKFGKFFESKVKQVIEKIIIKNKNQDMSQLIYLDNHVKFTNFAIGTRN